MPSKWIVTFSMDQQSGPDFVYSADIDENTKEFRVHTHNYTKILKRGEVLEQHEVESAIANEIPKNISTVIISTPTHITFFGRQSKKKSPFKAKKKRAVKSNSKSRRKSRSPRRV